MGWHGAGDPVALAAVFLISAATGEVDRASGTPLDAGDPGDTARSHLETGTAVDECKSISLPLTKEALLQGEDYLAFWKHEDYASPRAALLELLDRLIASQAKSSASKQQA